MIDDKDNPCDPAYVLAALVRQAIAQEKTKNHGRPGARNYLGEGARVQNIRIGSPVVRPAEFPSTNACFYLLITLEIVEDTLNPFG